jgi:hypothetical protein
VPVDAWADDWQKKPTEEVCIGLKLISEADERTARAVASKNALQAHPKYDEDPAFADAFADALISSAVAVAACDPNNVNEPWADFGGSEDIVRSAFTSKGLRFMWDQIDRMKVALGPSEHEATDDELDELHALLVTVLHKVSTNEQKRIRRLLGHCLRKLRAFAE